MKKALKIKNKNNEFLDTSFDGLDLTLSKSIMIFNHGFGTDKHERGLFDDIVEKLDGDGEDTAFIRFSYTGYGESEGKQEEKTLDTMADDLVSVWQYVQEHKSKDAIVKTLSFSMGNHVLTKALGKVSLSIETMICVNPSSFVTGEAGKAKWASRSGAEIDTNNVLIIPRADGSITKIGQGFWDSIDPVAYKNNLTEAAKKYNSVLIRAVDDHIVENTEVAKLPFKKIFELHGDHNFSKPEDREVFLNTIASVLLETKKK